MPLNASPAQQAIAAHNDGLETLKRLLDLVDNRAALLDAHKEARAESALTEEQAEKHKKALELMDKAEEMAQQIVSARAEVNKAQTDLLETEESFRAWRDEETARLKTQKDEQDAQERQNKADAKKLETDRKDMEREFSEKVTPIDDARAQNEKDAAANEKEAARLKKLASKLDQRDKKVKAAIVGGDDEEEAA